VTLATHGYTFVFEREVDGPFGVEGHRKSVRAADGTESDLDEDITITCGDHTARIVNGRLTAGGRDRGAVKPGDRIALTGAGGLSVNGAER
jgi:hypothetical protein